MKVTVFGLGEAGAPIASDLARSGLEVQAYDPAEVPSPEGLTRHGDPEDAVSGSEMVLAITAAADAMGALGQAIEALSPGTVYADLATSAPSQKSDLAALAAERGLEFADVALMGPVPGRGISTPALASGPAAVSYADFANRHGGRVEALSPTPGDAATRKLLRSVVTKGLTSVLIESLRAADAHGSADWLWPHLVDELTVADEALLKRLLDGTPPNVERRIGEMESAVLLLESLGVEPTMTRATTASLRSIRDDGIPNRERA